LTLQRAQRERGWVESDQDRHCLLPLLGGLFLLGREPSAETADDVEGSLAIDEGFDQSQPSLRLSDSSQRSRSARLAGETR